MIVSQYPQIVLHDGFVKKIIVDNESIIFVFDEKNGFWVKNEGTYYRAKKSYLSVKLKDYDSYKTINKKTHPVLKVWSYSVYCETTIDRINKEILNSEFQIVDELYSPDSMFIIAHLGLRGMCYTYIEGTDLFYHWEGLDYNNKMY